MAKEISARTAAPDPPRAQGDLTRTAQEQGDKDSIFATGRVDWAYAALNSPTPISTLPSGEECDRMQAGRREGRRREELRCNIRQANGRRARTDERRRGHTEAACSGDGGCRRRKGR